MVEKPELPDMTVYCGWSPRADEVRSEMRVSRSAPRMGSARKRMWSFHTT